MKLATTATLARNVLVPPPNVGASTTPNYPALADQAIHPVPGTNIRVFAGQRNSFLSVANVDFYYALEPNWQTPETGDVTTIAKLRNGAPSFP